MRERGEDGVIERVRAGGWKQSDTQREEKRERERESGPALAAHIAGWLAGSLTVDE